MKKYFILVIPLFLVMLASPSCMPVTPTEEQNIKLSGKIENGIRVIEIKASRYKFEPDPIVVKLGEKIRLVATSTDVTHGLVISEFKVKLFIPVGKTENVEFIADKKGAFHAHCSVYCGPGHGRMHAIFIVGE